MTAHERYLEVKNRPDEKLSPEYKAKMTKNYAKNAGLAKDAQKLGDTRKEYYYRNLANAYDHEAFRRDFM